MDFKTHFCYPLSQNGGHVPNNELNPNERDGSPSPNDQSRNMNSRSNSPGNTQETQNDGHVPNNEIYPNDLDGSPLSNEQSQHMEISMNSLGNTQDTQNGGQDLSNEIYSNYSDGYSSHTNQSQSSKRRSTSPSRPQPKKPKHNMSPQISEGVLKQHRLRKRTKGSLPRKRRTKDNKIPAKKGIQAKIIQWNICGLRGKIPE